MTISTTDRKVNHLGNGNVTEFFYTFRCDDESWMVPLLDDVQVFTGFTVNLNSDYVGGSVAFETAPDMDVVVTLARSTPQDQQIDYQAGDPFPVDSHENGFDKITMMIQELQEQALRSINLPISDDGTTSVVFPAYDPGKLIGWCDATQSLCVFDVPVCPPAYVDPYNELYGRIANDGSIDKGSGGYQASRDALGQYSITFDTEITQDYTVVASLAEAVVALVVQAHSETTAGFKVNCNYVGGGGDFQDRAWSFHLVYETP